MRKSISSHRLMPLLVLCAISAFCGGFIGETTAQESCPNLEDRENEYNNEEDALLECFNYADLESIRSILDKFPLAGASVLPVELKLQRMKQSELLTEPLWLYLMGRLYKSGKKYYEAERYFTSFLSMTSNNPSCLILQGSARYHLGWSQHYMHHHDNAKKTLWDCTNELDDFPLGKLVQTECMIELASTLKTESDDQDTLAKEIRILQEAKLLALKAKSQAEDAGLKKQAALAGKYLGNILKDEAIKTEDDSVKMALFDQAKNEYVCAILRMPFKAQQLAIRHNLATVDLLQENLQSALKSFKALAKEFEAISNNYAKSICLSSAAEIEGRIGNHKESLSLAEQAYYTAKLQPGRTVFFLGINYANKLKTMCQLARAYDVLQELENELTIRPEYEARFSKEIKTLKMDWERKSSYSRAIDCMSTDERFRTLLINSLGAMLAVALGLITMPKDRLAIKWQLIVTFLTIGTLGLIACHIFLKWSPNTDEVGTAAAFFMVTVLGIIVYKFKKQKESTNTNRQSYF